MKALSPLTFILFLVLLPRLVFSQAINNNQPEGKIDNMFNTSDVGFGFGEGANGGIFATAIQPDGKIIIAGNFTAYNGMNCNRIARLNMDGSLDVSFNPGTGTFNGEIRKVLVLPDGKIIAGGTFTLFNGLTKNRIVKLSSSGAIETFYGTANADVTALALQSDGKVVVGGNFTSFNSTTKNRIVRLANDGQTDNGFLGTGANGIVNEIFIQPDGNLVIAGDFTQYSGTARNRIARVFAGGTLDFSFNPGSGANAEILAASIQSDGKIVMGGNFSDYNGTSRSRVARVNADGTLDMGFNPGSGADNSIRTIALQSDGKILLGGSFTNFNGNTVGRIVKLNANGSIDSGFASGTGANNDIYSLIIRNSELFISGLFTDYNGTPANKIIRTTDGGGTQYFNSGQGTSLNSSIIKILQQQDGKVIIAGNFTSYNGVARRTIARLNADGSADLSFDAGSFYGFVNDFAIQADGKIILAGYYLSLNGTSLQSIVRLNTDGSMDLSFNADTGNNPVNTVLIDGTGKILISGGFVSLNGLQRKGFARLNTNGTVDSSFNPGTGVTGGNASIIRTRLRTDGKIMIVGDFTSYNGTARNKIASINSNGTLDTNFDSGSGPNYSVSDLELTSDGKILIAGNFTKYKSSNVKGVAKLNTDGTIDASFGVGTGPINGLISDLFLQSDGKIILTGDFTSFNGSPDRCVVRLNPGGPVDVSFNPNYGTEGEYGWAIAPVRVDKGIQLSNGKILICGKILSYNGINAKSIAQLNLDGTLDFGFNKGPLTGSNGIVYALTQQSDKKLIMGGSFTTYNALTANKVCRINADGSLDLTFSSGGGPNGNVKGAIIQPDGKILIQGDFTTYNGVARKNVARLNSDGSLDLSFAPDPGTGTINAIALQSDNKILLGGSFNTLNGSPLYNLGRVNSNGSLDATFTPGSGPNNYVVAIAIQADGKIVISGLFDFYNGTSRRGIARVNTTGGLDTGFNPGVGINQFGDMVYTIVIDNSNKIYIGGNFTKYNNLLVNRIARINTNGSFDGTFNQTTGPNGNVYTIAIQFDGKVLIGGDFTTYDGTLTNRFVRLNTNGTKDNTLNYVDGSNGTVYSIYIRPNDRKILIGGEFTSYNGIGKNRVARIIGPPFSTQLQWGHCDGFVDETFGWEINCDPVLGATRYEWEFTDSSNQVAYAESNGWILFLNQMPNFSYFIPGQTYSVRVRAKDNIGWLDYGGQICSLVVGNPSAKKPSQAQLIINENSDNNSNAYPNPSLGIFNINLSNDNWETQTVDVVVYDLLGRPVVTLLGSDKEFELNLSSFQDGTYILRAYNSRKSQSIRLIKN